MPAEWASAISSKSLVTRDLPKFVQSWKRMKNFGAFNLFSSMPFLLQRNWEPARATSIRCVFIGSGWYGCRSFSSSKWWNTK